MCVAIIIPCLAYSQSGNDPEQVIRRMVHTGIFEGHDSKVIGPMGDAAAVLLTKILAGSDLTAANIDMSLLVLRESFADPSTVQNAVDRQPRTALFVLRCLDSSTTDPSVRKRIANAAEYVEQQYLKSKGAASPK